MCCVTGFMATTIVADSPAYEAGMRRNDIITHIDGAEINNFDDLVAFMQTRSMGDVSVFSVVRGGTERLELTITLGEYFQNRF